MKTRPKVRYTRAKKAIDSNTRIPYTGNKKTSLKKHPPYVTQIFLVFQSIQASQSAADLGGYGISYDCPDIEADDDWNYNEEEMIKVIGYLRSLLPIERIVHETFQILFNDRGFLLCFNQIVANVGGTNDPINFQLLCSRCNLKKFTNQFTSDKYPVYWSLEG